MRIVALLTIRNEVAYLERCLRHLHEQGIETCVIDNDSSDGSAEVAKQFIGQGVIRVDRLRYDGYFDLVAQCRQQEQLAMEIDADWFIHHDADEIREPPPGWGTLSNAIKRADAAGYNAIDFAEFVFLPNDTEASMPADYVRGLKHYYYFQPTPLHRVTAWKKTVAAVNLEVSGGHRVEFAGRKILPEQFVLRHYIGLSVDHLLAKYSRRTFSEAEVHRRGWHGWRAEFDKWQIRLPNAAELKLNRDDGIWDKSDPKSVHLFIVRREDA